MLTSFNFSLADVNQAVKRGEKDAKENLIKKSFVELIKNVN
jgi:hypothetical protein